MSLTSVIHEMSRILDYVGTIGHIAGDDGALNQKGDLWSAKADDLRATRRKLDHILAAQLPGGQGGNWNDAASDAFRAAWNKEAAHFDELAQGYDTMAKALHDVANEVTNFNHATKMVLLELAACLALAIGLAFIPVVDVTGEEVVIARAIVLVGRWAKLVVWIIRLWTNVRKWFAINLLILYSSRFAERWIKLGDPTKGWTKNDGIQLTTSAAVAAVLGGVLALPGAVLKSTRLAVLADDLAAGRLAAGTPLVKGSAAAAQVAGAGFRTGLPPLLRVVPGLSRVMNVVKEVPALADVSKALAAYRKPGLLWLLRAEPENRLLANPKLLAALYHIRVPSFLTGQLAPGVASAGRLSLWTGKFLNARPLNAVVTATTFNATNAYFIAHTPYTWTGSEWSGGSSIIVVALNRGVFGGALPLPATASSVLLINGALEVSIPAVARSRGVNFTTHLNEVETIDGQIFLMTPAGPIPIGHPPVHTVRPGDNLWDIASGQYGSGLYYSDIAGRNHVPNPDLIQPGQRLVLPPVDPNHPAPAQAAAAAPAAPHTGSDYGVRDHDSLWSIAQRAYGDGGRWREIAAANHLHGTTIHQGERLWIPPLGSGGRRG